MPEPQAYDDTVVAPAPIPPLVDAAGAMGLSPPSALVTGLAPGGSRNPGTSETYLRPSDAYMERQPYQREIPADAGSDDRYLEQSPATGASVAPEGAMEPAQQAPKKNPGFVDPTNPYKLPPEAGEVIGIIRAAEGTMGRQGYVLFGGRPFVPGYEHPAREGWQGSSTQYGPTHAAGPGQWQPGTWDDEKKVAKEQGLDLDFGRGADQDWAIWNRASRLYHNATGRDLAEDQKTGKFDPRVLGSEWQGLLRGTGSPSLRGGMTGVSPALQARADALEREADSLRDSYHRDTAELMRIANAAPPGSRERDDAIAKLREKEHEYRDKYEQIASHPPVLKPVDALANFGSVGTIVAMLGGLFARRHMTTALGAAGEAMKAINQNDWEKFQQEYKTWDQQSKTALDMVKLHNEEIRSLIDDKKMAVDEKNTRLRFMFDAFKMNEAADQMALGAHEKVLTQFVGLEKATQSAAQNRFLVQQGVYANIKAKLLAEGVPEAEADERAARLSGMIPGGSQSNRLQQPRQIEIVGADGKVATDADGKPMKGAAIQIGPNKWSWVGSDKPIELPPNTTVNLRSTAQPRSAPGMYLQKFMEEHPEATSKELATASSEYRKWQAIESGYGSGVLARQLISLNTVADHLQLVQQYAEELKNGQIPRANAIANRIATELGKPEVTSFEAGRDIMADEVVRLLTSTGGTEADRKGMQSRLSSAMSPQQLAGALTAFNQFVGGRFEALEQHYAGNDPDRKKHFEEEMLTEKGRQVFAGTKQKEATHDTPAPSGAAPGNERIPLPEAFKNDPDGTGYRKDGAVWVKNGNQLVRTPGATETPR